jgi:hypothetical protein
MGFLLIPFFSRRRAEVFFIAAFASRRLLRGLIRTARIDLICPLLRMIFATRGRRFIRG